MVTAVDGTKAETSSSIGGSVLSGESNDVCSPVGGVGGVALHVGKAAESWGF